MSLTIVTTKDRPDLVPATSTWRWEAFFKNEMALAEMLERDADYTRNPGLMPTTLVLLDHEKPVGMATLCLNDIDGRPELNPWLADVYVDERNRDRGHAVRLINAVEVLAKCADIERLSLYTADAAGLYAKAGWNTVETFEKTGKVYSIMQKWL